MTHDCAKENATRRDGDVHAKRVAYAACRLTPRERARAEAAATLEGARYLSTFVRNAVLRHAGQVLERETSTKGSEA